MAKVTIDQKAKTITITLPLQEPKQSKSGKTMVIATTNGNVASGATYDGQDVVIGVNAYFKE